jgi:hypothetical protein
MTERTSEQEGGRSSAMLFANVALAVSSCFVCVILMIAAEGIVRLCAPDYLIRTRGVHVFSSTYGWIGRPGVVTPMGSGLVSLNERGFRGRTLALPKSGDRARVVVLGDSVAFGFGVSDEQTFAQLLDGRLKGIEVANLAVQGYGPGQELLVLQREGLSLDPDVVVLALCLRNDFVDAVLPVALYNGVTPRPRFRLKGGSLVLDDASMRRSMAERTVQWLGDYSHLFNRVWALVGPRPEPVEQIWRDRKRESLRDEEAALELTVALVLEMERVTRESHASLLVATFPNGLGYEGEPQLHRRLHAELADAGLRVVDFRARFLELGLAPSEIALDSTGHLAVPGHVLVAEALEHEIAALLQQRLDREP